MSQIHPTGDGDTQPLYQHPPIPPAQPTQQVPHTAPLPALGAPPPLPPPAGPAGAAPSWHQAAPPPRERRGRGLAAGVLAGAVILGGLSGLGGSWAYDRWGTDPGRPAASTGFDPTKAVSVNYIAKQVLPSVVQIVALDGLGNGGTGSGIILSEDGEILTNHHVVEPALEDGHLTISFNDGTLAEAEVVGTDPLTDTALVRAVNVSGLSPITIGSSDDAEVGQAAIVIGSPYGLQATVTAGIISALHRPVLIPTQSDPSKTSVYGAIQTDADINPGNSGGAMVNLDGELIGINSAGQRASDGTGGIGDLGSIGIGYAIPIDDALPIIEQLRAGETPTHAVLGVFPEDATNVDGVANGALVTEVAEDSGAEAAGIEPDDVITSVGGIHTGSADSLIATIYSFRPGETADVVVVRDGEEQALKVTFGSDADQ